MRIARAAAAIAAVAMTAAGCRTHDLAFRTDRRVEIIAPEFNAVVRLPFEIRWNVHGFVASPPDGRSVPGTGHFGVFLDVSPMPPGEGIGYFARDDEECRRTAGCPDETYLNNRNIYFTAETSFKASTLVDTRPSGRPSASDRHEITIVLLDGKRRRIGESAWNVAVFVDRGSA